MDPPFIIRLHAAATPAEYTRLDREAREIWLAKLGRKPAPLTDLQAFHPHSFVVGCRLEFYKNPSIYVTENSDFFRPTVVKLAMIKRRV